MPKVGMEPLRKRAFIDAAIRTIGERGSLDKTVAQIAQEAGVSAALAHHYFGGKEQLILATMRHLLNELGQDLLGRATQCTNAIGTHRSCYRCQFFCRAICTAAIVALGRHSTFMHSSPMRRAVSYGSTRGACIPISAYALQQLTDRETALQIAEGTGELIDGLYIRHALRNGAPEAAKAIALVEDYVTTKACRLRTLNRARPMKPNILVIMVDQLNGTLFPDGPADFIHAPHLKALAQRSARFANTYTASPLCAPARASLMSGQLPSRTRVYDNAAEFASDIPTYAHHLRRAGYYTGLSGKMHFVGPDQFGHGTRRTA